MASPATLLATSPWEPLAIARPLSWVVVAAFLGAALLEGRDREKARALAAGTWVLFGAFWLVLVPHFVFEQRSIVEGLGSIAAVPLSLYAGHLLWRGRDSLFVLSKAVGLMGLLYLPFTYLPLLESNPARQWLVESVAAQTHVLLGLIDVHPTLGTGNCELVPAPACNYESTFRFAYPDTFDPTYSIIIACTGLGSISIFAGGIMAVKAPLRRKLRALALSVSIIYALNLVRNVFIAASFGEMWMQFHPELVASVFGFNYQMHPARVSYYIADRILAQFGSVIALVLVTWLVVRELPEIVVIVEDLLYLLTGTDYDLQGAISVERDEGAGGTAAIGDDLAADDD